MVVIIVELLVSFELEFVLLSCDETETGSDAVPSKRNKIEKSTRAIICSTEDIFSDFILIAVMSL